MNPKKLLKQITPHFLLDWYHLALPLVGSIVYGLPSKKLIVIGVTGTSGKSTTVDFISRILEEAGESVASISSVRFKIKDKEWKNDLKMTTPGRMKIQQFLKQAQKAGCKYAVLEVASEGIKQHRHRFIDFDAAVFTNLTPEHLEAHGGFEAYRGEKIKLFKVAKNIHIINVDDENAKYFLEIPSKKLATFGIKNEADVRAEDVKGTQFTVDGIDFDLQFLGSFNVYNALAAIALVRHYKIDAEVCRRALEKVEAIPGRMEVVSKNPLVVVDYAHTPEQLELAYQSLSSKNLVCVLGSCGGGRDKWKRVVFGELAEKYCKEIIITNEDPYDEDPLEIMEQVAGGIQDHSYSLVMDRKEAIKKALALANPEDAVIITGKGSEVWMALANGKKIPWSDKNAVFEALTSKKP